MRRSHDVCHTPNKLLTKWFVFYDIKLGGDAIENDLDPIIFNPIPPNRWIQI
jgi:hypothetical protein